MGEKTKKMGGKTKKIKINKKKTKHKKTKINDKTAKKKPKQKKQKHVGKATILSPRVLEYLLIVQSLVAGNNLNPIFTTPPHNDVIDHLSSIRCLYPNLTASSILR
jgi:hypothetical protein